ncbi:MAG: metallopeptidase family protein [Gammaproteobacteria bacterium]
MSHSLHDERGGNAQREADLAPSIADFERIAHAAFESMPRAFTSGCDNLIVRVADFAGHEVLAHMNIEDPFELTGIYSGVDLRQKSVTDALQMPDEVWLYRRPILEEWIERGDVGLAALIAHVLVHEIGHHFGLSDEDMEAVVADL